MFVANLSQTNPLHIFQLYFFKINLLLFLHQNSVCSFLFVQMCHMSRPSRPPVFHKPLNIYQGINIIISLSKFFHSVFYFLSLASWIPSLASCSWMFSAYIYIVHSRPFLVISSDQVSDPYNRQKFSFVHFILRSLCNKNMFCFEW
jgi:hypothetical protein